LLNYLTSSQLSEWEAYDRIDPIGKWREDFNVANLMALIANVNRNPKKKSNPFTISDFMPEWGKEEEKEKRQTVEEMKQAFMSIFPNLKKK
jgi:hypothetical protein